MKEILRLGSMGAGFVANFQQAANQLVPGLEFGGVHALKGAEQLAAKATATGEIDCVVYKSVADLVEHCDVIANFAPNPFRVELMEQVVDAATRLGKKPKGLICEKPLGRTITEARRMVELAKTLGCPTSYFENQIHMKAIKAGLKGLARVQGKMGPLVLARGGEEHSGPHEGWFWDATRQGGGVLSDMACHTIAVLWRLLTPVGKDLRFLRPVSIGADTLLLKWGQPKYRAQLLKRMGVDYALVPAEDFATGLVTFENPETRQRVVAQFATSWMYDKQGLRLSMEGMGPGYALEVNSLRSSLEVFIGDAAAEAVTDAEGALEKSTASRGLLAVQPNEPDLYGYVDEQVDARDAFREGHDGLLNWEYGLEITRLCQAAYMAAEKRQTLDLTDPAVQTALETYRSLISQGKGHSVLYPDGKVPE
ncbi:MAG: Gfo/Idh/MocA family oxidoreductase [Patescibacteria group bacterium]|jgi:predicted dehydrogenase